MKQHEYIAAMLYKYYVALGEKHKWIIEQMAKEAGVSRQNVYYMMGKLKLWRYASETRVVVRKKSKDPARPDTKLVVGKDTASEPERDTRLPGVRSW